MYIYPFLHPSSKRKCVLESQFLGQFCRADRSWHVAHIPLPWHPHGRQQRGAIFRTASAYTFTELYMCADSHVCEYTALWKSLFPLHFFPVTLRSSSKLKGYTKITWVNTNALNLPKPAFFFFFFLAIHLAPVFSSFFPYIYDVFLQRPLLQSECSPLASSSGLLDLPALQSGIFE